MIRTPNAPDTFIDTRHRLDRPLELLPTGIAQQQHLFQNLLARHIPYANGLFPPIDVVARHARVSMRSWRDGYLDLRMCFGEAGEVVLEKDAGGC